MEDPRHGSSVHSPVALCLSIKIGPYRKGSRAFIPIHTPITFDKKLRMKRLPLWSNGHEFLTTDVEVSGSIPGAVRFSEM
jgi:hypothetical protein